MSARDNILAKLRKANAYPMIEPKVDEYYRETSQEWDSETERLKHWAKTMRAVKTEIYWVTPETWPQTMVRVAGEKHPTASEDRARPNRRTCFSDGLGSRNQIL